ncbi:uncharacterized protein LOC131249481 [Magnolia sinica]|uniref:uncharacterized protein LOC131249481 n=1 Tax=Magnolia sinica TaxID=86752 RepID=UPI002659FBBD|nr:uncharacterized protein LOC131249481 [Magnolia sinica]
MAQFFLKAALKGDWEAITTRYREQPALCNDTPVTNMTGDTLIHIAVQSGQAEAVAELLDLLPEHVRVAKNNVGNTSLHEAARTGMLIKTARAILKKDASLVSSRNKPGETPVFWAAMHGNKEMLLFLVSDVRKVGEETLRRSDGSTILHVAILGKFYDVALEIVEMFPGMALSRDERGITALHLLTLFPSSFKSRGIYSLPAVLDPPNFLRVSIPVVKLLHAAVFDCVPVDPYQTSDGSDQGQSRLKSFTETCMDFLRSAAANPKLIIAKEKHAWALQLARLLIKKEAQWRYGHDGRSPREEAQWSYEHDARCPQRSNGQHQIGEQHQIGNDGDECKERLERPLILASKCGIVKLVEEILKAFPESIEFLDDKRHQIGDDGDEYKERLERPLILATKCGIVELVEEILKAFPESIEFLDDKAGKNLLHLAVEYRQVHVFNLLKKEKRVTTVLAAGIDKNGNTILHLAAKFKKDNSSHVGGPVIQMHQENAWFEALKVQAKRPASMSDEE